MKKANLVVIDDEFPVLYTIRAILEADHPGLMTFQNPVEGLEHIARDGCRVLVTDLKMPGLDGLEVLQRSLKLDPDIQVIMLTAHGSEKIAVEALKRNAYHYITKPFDHEELKLLVRKALEQYELRKRIQYDLEMAAALQANLLPQQAFRSEQFQIEFQYLPGGNVGGDYFDFLPLSGDALGVFIADASGHGISAAMMMAMLKVVFQNTAPSCSRPSRLLAEINRQFYTVLKSRASFTAFYTILKPDPWRMVCANAGHPNPLLFRPGAAGPAPAQASGMAIGFFPDCEYEDVEIPLERGDQVLFYTDGLSDLAIEENFFVNFETLFQKKSSEFTSNLLECLLCEIYKYRSKQEDDITLLLLRH